MKKIIVLIIFLFLTGCKAEYKLEFIDDTFTENLTIISPSGLEYEAIKNNTFAPVPAFINSAYNLEEPVKNEGVEYYELTEKNDDVNLEYKFNISDFADSYIVNSCYNYFKIFREEEKTVISTGKEFTCFQPGREIEEINIIITTNHKVLYNNADRVSNNKYIWNLKNDDSDKNIQISFSNQVEKNSINKEIIFILISLCIIISTVVGGIYIKNKQVNKI